MQTLPTRRVELSEVADNVLLEQARAGQQEAFAVLVHRHTPLLFTVILHLLDDYDQACDIVQHVFIQLYLALPTFATDEPLKPWLCHVARNRCLDDLRKQQRRCTFPFSEIEAMYEEEELTPLVNIPDTSPLPEEVAEQHDIQQYLWRAIQTLPPKFGAVVALRYSTQLSFPEIAELLGMREATTRTYFQRAKPLLRTALDETVLFMPMARSKCSNQQR